jgi:RND family efflux transporter MFP subunit
MNNIFQRNDIRPGGPAARSMRKGDFKAWGRNLFFVLFALGCITSVVQKQAWAHGDAPDGHSHGETEQTAPIAAGGGSTETEIEVRLTDLNAGATGTEPPLAGATLRGLLKRPATGEILGRVEAHASDTPGVYKLHFGEREAYQFAQAGKYALELNIQPRTGEAVDTTVEFVLPAMTVTVPPLWRRVLPLVLGVLVVVALIVIGLKSRGQPRGPKPVSTEFVQKSLVLALLAGAISGPVWAGGDPSDGHSHGPSEGQGAAPAASTTSVSPNIQLGETSTTAKAGPIRITVITRTRPATPQAMAPGEVSLPAQTAELLRIRTQLVRVGQLSTGITFTGQIAADPNGTVRVASIVPGRVTRLNVAQGDTVKQGQILAVVESRAIGEAQSAHQLAIARFRNAQSNLNVVQQQARAGVFSRAPLEAAQRSQAEAAGEVRGQEAAVQQAQGALDNVMRVARVGGYANPALETARNNEAQTREALRTAQAALANARALVSSAQAELARRRQLAASGSYQSRPVEEARRSLVAAQSARAAATSEVATTRANLARARSLSAEGLISQRDLEAAQQAQDTAMARLETAQADERTAHQELTRQQQVAASDVAGTAEMQQAQAALAAGQADVRTRQAEVQRANSQLQVAQAALSRERTTFEQNIANRREIETARANLQAAQAGLYRARRVLATTNTQLEREQVIFRRNLNNTSQVQTARSGFVAAQADLRAARSALALLKSSPGGSVAVPIRAPMSGVVQTRDIAVGELIQADAPLLTLVNLKNVALEVALFEADFERVRIGSPVRVTTEAVPGRGFSGRISFLGSAVDPQTRSVTARAMIENPGNLRPGMFARGQIQTGIGQLAVTVPESAVLDDGAAKIVFVAKGGRYERREVEPGNINDGRVEIKSGLKQGETVVTEGAAALRAQAANGV